MDQYEYTKGKIFMSATFYDVGERLKKQGEVTVLELLEISSEDLVERFEDKILETIDFLLNELDEEEEFIEEGELEPAYVPSRRNS